MRIEKLGALLSVAILAGCTTTQSAPSAATPTGTAPDSPVALDVPHAALPITGPLCARGTQLLDQCDPQHPVRLLGVNSTGLEIGAGRDHQHCTDSSPNDRGARFGCWSTPAQQGLANITDTEATFRLDDIYSHVAMLGFNVARLPISWANLETAPPLQMPQSVPGCPPLQTGLAIDDPAPVRLADGFCHYFNQPYLTALGQTIDAFAKNGIAVILAFETRGWSPAFPQFDEAGACTGGVGVPPWLYPDYLEWDRYIGCEGTRYRCTDTECRTTRSRARVDFFADTPNAVLAAAGYPGGSAQAALATAEQYVAGRFRRGGGGGVVGIDMWSEANASAGNPRLAGLLRRIADAVQNQAAGNPDVLLIFHDSPVDENQSILCDLDGRCPALQPLTVSNKIVYSVHLRPNPSVWDEFAIGGMGNAREQLMAAWRRSLLAQVPLYIGELGAIGDDAQGWQADLPQVVNVLRGVGASWTYWAYQGAHHPIAAPELCHISGAPGPCTDQLLARDLKLGF